MAKIQGPPWISNYSICGVRKKHENKILISDCRRKKHENKILISDLFSMEKLDFRSPIPDQQLRREQTSFRSNWNVSSSCGASNRTMTLQKIRSWGIGTPDLSGVLFARETRDRTLRGFRIGSRCSRSWCWRSRR